VKEQMPPATRGQGKSQSKLPVFVERLMLVDRPRESSQHLPNRNAAPTTLTPPQPQSRSGTTTPDTSTGQAAAPSVSTTIVPNDVKEYLHSSIFPLLPPNITLDLVSDL
jgi:hypothetical protein